MSTSVDLQEFIAGFLIEAEEHLHSVSRNLVATAEALKKGSPEPRAIRELYRSIHTIKGLASMVSAQPIVDITHEMENILRGADRAGGRLSESALDLLLRATRAVEDRVRALSQAGISGIPPAPLPLLEALAENQRAPVETNTGGTFELSLPPAIGRSLSVSEREQVIQAKLSSRNVWLIEFQPSAERAAKGHNITSLRSLLGGLGELVKVIPHAAEGSPTGIAFYLLLVTDEKAEKIANTADGADISLTPVTTISTPAAPPERSAESGEWAPGEHATIRVEVRRLDEALERLSELVVTRFKLSRAAADLAASGADTRELGMVLAENTRQLKRLRAAITQARMVPLAELLQRLPLVVRGIVKDSDKAVNVVLQTSSAEVDKSVADKIFPAIIHLVRNAVDHALEPKEERERLGKPETGTLSILCDDSSGTDLVITIRDDGRGVDREAVARKAGQPVARNDEELLKQIAMPGLSTRDGVTQTSGRGMGMDIAKKTVEMLGGRLSLQSTPGTGSTFILRVPVSVTIIDVFSFIADGQTFVAPVSTIEEIIEIDQERMVRSPVPQSRGPRPLLVQRRDDTIPLLSLGSLLKKEHGTKVPPKALVVRQSGRAIAFGVDRMLGQQEVVVRPLDENLFRLPGMAGATDLGDGRPTLVLDLLTLGTTLSNLDNWQ